MTREYRSAVTVRSGVLSVVTDLDLAIYCHFRNRLDPSLCLEIKDVVRLAPGQHEVFFSDPKDQLRRLELEFLNSRESLLLDSQRSVKRVLRDTIAIKRSKAEVERHARNRQG